jgi:Cysteine-rich secretory protein family
MVRRVLQFIAVVIMATIPLALAVTPARADDISDFLGQVNALRADHGLPALTTSATLTSDAQAWTRQMASSGVFEDDPNLAAQVGGGWSRLGENTAEGTSFDLLFNALVNSPPHLANMLGSYTLTGVGEVVTTGGVWLTEIFEAPSGVKSIPTPVTTVPTISRPPSTTKAATPAKSAVRVATSPPRAAATTTAPASATTVVPTTIAAPSTTTSTPPPSPSIPVAVGAAGGQPRTSTITPSPVGAVVLSGHETPGVALRDWVLWISVAAIAMIAGAGWLAGRVLRRH